MKRLLNILLYLFVFGLAAFSQSGVGSDGYNPDNPGDPQSSSDQYILTLSVDPEEAADLNFKRCSLQVGQQLSIDIYRNLYNYTFVGWVEGDSIWSTRENFYFEMPDRDVHLVAKYSYDPKNPRDPVTQQGKVKVCLEANPKNAGYFHKSEVTVPVNGIVSLEALNNKNFSFEGWYMDGTKLSDQNPFEYRVGEQNVRIQGRFVYNPFSPQNPGTNKWNSSFGELVITDFYPGDLMNAIVETLGNYNHLSKVKSISVSGALYGYDWDVFSELYNCEIINLGRCFSLTTIKNGAFDCKNLKRLVLPASVEKFGSYVFSSCPKLQEITIFSKTPPLINPDTFGGIDVSQVVIRVLPSALYLYQTDDLWGGIFTILPITDDTYNLTVKLPKECEDGRYKNMLLELVNIKSGSSVRYVISDRLNYTFGGLQEFEKFDLWLKTPQGEQLGIVPDIVIGKEDLFVTFDSLKSLYNVELQVLSPDGRNVTNQVRTIWRDKDHKFLKQGSLLTQLLAGTELSYEVIVDRSLGLVYNKPEVQNYVVVKGNNLVHFRLSDLSKKIIRGKVSDVSGQPISNASVTVSQKVNTEFMQSFMTKSEDDGSWKLTVFDAPLSVCYSAMDYVPCTIEVPLLGEQTDLGDCVLKQANVTTLNLALTYQKVRDNVNEKPILLQDFVNMSFHIYNETQQKAVTAFSVQAPNILILDEVNVGDILNVTVLSTHDKFSPVSGTAMVQEDKTRLAMNVVAHGALKVSYAANGARKTTANLYKSTGEIWKTVDFDNQSLVFDNVAAGEYTLVTMEKNNLFNSILNLSQYSVIDLHKGIDYLENKVKIQDGALTTLENVAVPHLDENKLKYTGDKTRFYANKTSVVAGNFATLNCEIDFHSYYERQVSDVSLVVDLPEDVRLVENSVMVGRSVSSYTLQENRLVIALSSNYHQRIRFCVIPTVPDECCPNAFVKFHLGEKEILQPIGAVKMMVKGPELSVDDKTLSSRIFVKGVGIPNATVNIYDDNVLIGKTQTSINGMWYHHCNIDASDNASFHHIHAVMDDGKMSISTEKKTVEYERYETIQPQKVRMLNRNREIVFDLQRLENNSTSYTFVPSSNSFTFLIDFTDNNTDRIKNVRLDVLLSDNTIRELDAKYDARHDAWVTHDTFSSIGVPTNCYVKYDLLPLNVDEVSRNIQQYDRLTKLHNDLYDQLEGQFTDNVITDTENAMSFEMSDEKGNTYLVDVVSAPTDHYQDSELTRVSYEGVDLLMKDTLGNDFYYLYLLEQDKTAAYEITFRNKQFVHKTTREVRNITDDPYYDQLDYLSGSYTAPKYMPWLDFLPVPFLSYVDEVFRGYNYWKERLPRDIAKLDEVHNKVFAELMAKCPDGTYKVDKAKIDAYYKRMQAIQVLRDRLCNNGFSMLEEWRKSLFESFCFEALTFRLGKILKQIPNIKVFYKSPKGSGIMGYLIKGGKKKREFWSDVIEKSIDDALNFNSLMGALEEPMMVTMGKWVPDMISKIDLAYFSLSFDINSSYARCKDKEEPKELDEGHENFRCPPVEPIIDPAGFVYEAVPSNRVQGVTASCYYKEFVEDMYGDKHENVILWNAEDYAQKNPLFTDENGMYRWDVPQGLWQVKFEKVGYQTTYSDWLPVPPPQLEVNIPMTQLTQPNLLSAKVYESGIDIVFDKYMDLNTLSTDNIQVMKNGVNVLGTLAFLNSEQASEASAVHYASKVRFIPQTPFIGTDKVNLFVNRKVKSYAGIQMTEDYSQDFDVIKEIKTVVADAEYDVEYGSERVIVVSVLPYDAGVGKRIIANSNSPLITKVSSEALLDENGQAQFTISGELLGVGVIEFSVDGTAVKAESAVNVVEKLNLLSKPTASRPSGSAVFRNTKVELATQLENVIIYYTLDGSCPCDAGALIYKSPIEITKDMRIRAMVVDSDGNESEIATFNYYIRKANLNLDLAHGWNWISHNLESPVKVADLGDEVERAQGIEGEVVRDSNYGLVGNLRDLNVAEAYKVKTNKRVNVPVSGYLFNSLNNSITLVKGWNWLGYPMDQTMKVSEAFANSSPTVGDIIVGLEGQAEYTADGWKGNLNVLQPGIGYLYKAISGFAFTYNNNIVSKAVSLYAPSLFKDCAPWSVNVHAYPNVMPVIAYLFENETSLNTNDCYVGAFCGTECRGIGTFVDGRWMITIHGEGGEKIEFKVVEKYTDEASVILESLTFVADNVGSYAQPIALHLGNTVGIDDLLETGITIFPLVPQNTMKVTLEGETMDGMTITNSTGKVVWAKQSCGELITVNVSNFPSGVYILTVWSCGKYYYQKFLKK